MKHVIVGGDGFVGRHIAGRLLERGERVVVCDIVRSDLDIYRHATHLRVDVTRPGDFEAIDLAPEDMVYNCAAHMLHPVLRRSFRDDWFYPTNLGGVTNLLAYMERRGCRRLLQFTTDMVYGHVTELPQDEDHPRIPLGPYGDSKKQSEDLCASARERGFRVTILRPRLIIGPGRIGILGRLFRLIDLNLPVPMIGSGRNRYQFVSVYDCADAALCAFDRGVPDGAFNLGSKDPPTVREVLGRLIAHAGSRSVLLPTPAPLVKATLALLDRLNFPLMDPEQYLIADEDCVRGIARAEYLLGWNPRFRDGDMLIAAYGEYRQSRNR